MHYISEKCLTDENDVKNNYLHKLHFLNAKNILVKLEAFMNNAL